MWHHYRDSWLLHSLSLTLSLSFTHSVMPFKLNRIWFSTSHIIVPSNGKWLYQLKSLPHIWSVSTHLNPYCHLIWNIQTAHNQYITYLLYSNYHSNKHYYCFLLNSVLHHVTSLCFILTLFIRNTLHYCGIAMEISSERNAHWRDTDLRCGED